MVSFDSVEKRRRLLRWLLDLIIVVIALATTWALVLAPFFRPARPRSAPVFTAQTLHGQAFSLRAQRGHMVVLDFFASWCEACQASWPIIAAFAAEFPGVRVVALDQGEEPAALATFSSHQNVPIVLDPAGQVGQAYGVTGLPTIVGIDAQGRIRNIWYGFSPQLGTFLRKAQARYGKSHQKIEGF